VRLAVAVLALALAAPAAAAPPREGVLRPGESLGGIRLGVTGDEVKRRWGYVYGVCRGCERPTWYFNYRAFEQPGAGVELRRGRVVAVFTLWSPAGWRTSRGLRIGDAAARATTLHGALPRVECGSYSALTEWRGRTASAIYLVDERVWGFALLRPGAPVCR
jgi:hypothetical protein